MDFRRVALRLFDALRVVALGGILASVLALVAAWVFASCAGWHCGYEPEQQLAWSGGLALGGAFGLLVFASVIVAAGGIRRRGKRWGRRHGASLAQARNWLAEGRLRPLDFEPYAAAFRRQEEGTGNGQVSRAAGASFLVAGLPALVGGVLALVIVANHDPRETAVIATIQTIGTLVVSFGGALSVLGILLYPAGLRETTQAARTLDHMADELATMAHHASVQNLQTKQARTRAAPTTKKKPV